MGFCGLKRPYKSFLLFPAQVKHLQGEHGEASEEEGKEARAVASTGQGRLMHKHQPVLSLLPFAYQKGELDVSGLLQANGDTKILPGSLGLVRHIKDISTT